MNFGAWRIGPDTALWPNISPSAASPWIFPMDHSNDPALDRMTELVRSLAGIMQPGNLPAVDFQDERAILDSAGSGMVGVGEASGENRARNAAALAVADLIKQLGGTR